MHKNAIVMMFDSLQYSYVGCYGNDRIKTPNMDRFAKEGVLFENCYTEGLPTVPCRRAMHTGRYTVHAKGWSALDIDDTTIADVCWGQGIDTAMVFDSPPNRLPKFGYTRGFDNVMFTHGHETDAGFYNKYPLYEGDPKDYVEEHTLRDADGILNCKAVDPLLDEITNYLKQRQYWKTAEDRYVCKTMNKAIRYLEEADRTVPFFLWIDSFDPHEPWDPPSVYLKQPCPYDPDYKGKDQFLPMMVPVDGIYTEEELHHIRMLYAELVTLCDQQFGRLLEAVRRLGLEDNTLLMMVSDHGEPMGNGEHGHGIMRKIRPWPYEELVHTPLIIRFPGCPAGTRVKGFVQSCDVAPTVCDWLGLGVQPFHTGTSILPLARGEVDKVRDFAIAGYYRYSWSIITEDWSFIHWLKADEKSVDDSMFEIYGRGIAEASADVQAVQEDRFWRIKERNAQTVNEEQRKYLEAATLDGADQWTCTPGSEATVPERDELYDRRKDPKQLVNVADQHPEVARKLLTQLQVFMQDLRVS